MHVSSTIWMPTIASAVALLSTCAVTVSTIAGISAAAVIVGAARLLARGDVVTLLGFLHGTNG